MRSTTTASTITVWLLVALAVVGCGGNAPSRSGDGGPGFDGADGAADLGILSGFLPSNVPRGTTLSATGDWIWDAETCASGGGAMPEIDGFGGPRNCQPGTGFTQMVTAQTNGGAIGLFVVNRLTIADGIRVRAIGSYPIVIVALGDVEIAGAIFASGLGTSAFAGGAGGDSAGPGGGAAPTATGGGGGAAHCGRGGDGGGNPGSGGQPYGNASITPLTGGSSGGAAGQGQGGGGGGVIQIVSRTSINVAATGLIHVGGDGGIFVGSGAGSGGAILLEAPSITIAGTLAANGGAGAGSGNLDQGGAAQPSASPAFSDRGSLGGNVGGNGAANTTIDGRNAPAPLSGNGGGGGGAVGRIRLNTASGAATLAATAVISPALSTACATQGTLAR